MPTPSKLQQAFQVYFDEIERCQQGGTYWALLHVVVSLPDICAALESDNKWTTEKKYVEWCRRYCPPGMLTAEDYRDIRNLVLHEGSTRTRSGRYYKFTRPTSRRNRVHRAMLGADVMVLDVGKLAEEMVASIQMWFKDLQGSSARERRQNVAKHLPSLVTVKEQEFPGISGMTFTATQTSTEPHPPPR